MRIPPCVTVGLIALEVTLTPACDADRLATPRAAGGDPPVVGSIALEPSAVVLSVYDGVRIETTVRSTRGERMRDVVLAFTSDNERVAAVSGSGQVTAGFPGSATITARANRVTGTATVTVQPRSPAPAVAAIVLDSASFIINVGDVRYLVATAVDDQGRPIPEAVVRFETVNARIVTVQPDPEWLGPNVWHLTGISAGKATISATAGGVTAIARVTVMPASSP